MAARTTSVAVQGILGTNYDGAADLTPFIETATILVDEVVTCAAGRGVTLSTALRELIERHLAAHFYGHADQFFQSKGAGGASGGFQGQTGMGLDGSQYGQTAKRLDVSGCLTRFDKGNTVAKLSWLGLPPSEQTDYEDRD